VRVLGIHGSPRHRGNSHLLLEEALAGATEAGAQTELIRAVDYQITGCIECNACFETGRCRIKDRYQELYDTFIACEAIVVSTPVFFMNVPAQLKAVIDRSQCFWAKRYILEQPVIEEGLTRPGGLIVVGGSKSRKMFEAVKLTVHYFFDALGVEPTEEQYINQVDDAGAIHRHPEALAEARRLGARLAAAGHPVEPGRPPAAEPAAGEQPEKVRGSLRKERAIEGKEKAERTFTLEELAQYTGKGGRPAYVAVRGVVYEVTESSSWEDGLHYDTHMAGRDLTQALEQGPHDIDLLQSYPVVGKLIE